MDWRGGTAAEVVTTDPVAEAAGTVNDGLVGQRLAGHFQVRARIATRGPLAIYRAVDTRHLKDVAVAARTLGPAEAEAAGADAAIVETLDHPNLLHVLDHGHHHGYYYVVTDLVRGRTLAQVANDEGPFSPGRALALVEPVLVGLAAAHARGIVHGAVRMQSVLVADDGRIKLADFLGDAGEGASGDVRAVGLMLHQLITGRTPTRPLAPVSSFARRVPSYVDELIAGATDPDPRRRPADAGMLLDQVRRVSEAIFDGRTSDPALSSALAGEDQTEEPMALATAPEEAPAELAIPNPRVEPELLSVPAPRAEATALATQTPDAPAAAEVLDADGAAAVTGRRTISIAPRWLAVGAAAIALVVSLVWWLASRGGAESKPDTVATPAVVGMSLTEATTALESKGLKIEVVDRVFSEVFPADQVVSSEPVSGAGVDPGSVVQVIVSDGRDQVFTPTLVWHTLPDAEVTLRRLGLSVGDVYRLYDDQKPAGTVIRIDPQAGASLPVGSEVDIYVSLGPDPAA